MSRKTIVAIRLLCLAGILPILIILLSGPEPACASEPDIIGLMALRAVVPGLTGEGVSVAHPESSESGWTSWQVNPVAIGQPAGSMTWISSAGVATNFPNGLGRASTHANDVATRWYGGTQGVAPGITCVLNYEASYFYSGLIQKQIPISARIVNQSFVFFSRSDAVDQAYDAYAVQFNTVFVSGAGNSGTLKSPASAYNGVSVGAYGGSSGIGPLPDGRCKPDLTAPAPATSYATPLVAGAVALLVQAGQQDAGGPGTMEAATDVRTLKALLLNGAVKSPDWTNNPASPLDARYGAGILNVFNAYRQLRGGQHHPSFSSRIPLDSPSPNCGATNLLSARRGWDFATVSSSSTEPGINHYQFELTGPSNQLFNFTATLVWHRQLNQTVINDLDLFLCNAETGVRVAASQSPANNVEHLAISNLPPGRYDLQVFKHGGDSQVVTADETYALAFDFTAQQPLVIQSLGLIDGAFHARVRGEPNQTYVVQATSDFRSWMPILTNQTPDSGTFEFSDSTSSSGDYRFYRALPRP